MSVLNSWSFRKKLILLWLTVQFLITGFTAVMVVNSAMESLEQDIRYQAEQIQPILNSALVTPLIQRDYASVLAILKELVRSENIETIRIYDVNSRLIAQEPSSSIRKELSTPSPYSVEFQIRADDIALGKANIDLSRARVINTRNQILINTALISALSLLVFFVFAILISRYITKPITDLAEIAKNISNGNFISPAFVPRKDEIGLLQNAFQSMSSEISRKIDDLRLLNTGLEQQVEDRTESLQKARNELLQKVDELKLLGAVVDNSHFAISIVDLTSPSTPIIYINSAFTRVTGYPAIESIGATCRVFQDGISDVEAMRKINLALKTQTDCTVEFLDQRKNGEPFWNRLSLFPVRISHASPRYFVIFQDDISALKKANFEREALLEDLQENQRLKSLGILIAGLAHEINNPIGIALTAATHISQTSAAMRKKDGELTPTELTDFLEDEEIAFQLIFENLRRASELVRGFKDIATDRSLDEKVEIHMLTYIKSIEQSLTPLLKQARCKLVLDIDPAISIQANTGSLGQLITNLVLNATIHAFDGIDDSQIEIVCYQDVSGIILKVADNGKGIPASALPNLFTPFFTTNRSKGGTGLGLYICRQIANDVFKGSLKMENRPDRGCEFILHIPKAPALRAAV